MNGVNEPIAVLAGWNFTHQLFRAPDGFLAIRTRLQISTTRSKMLTVSQLDKGERMAPVSKPFDTATTGSYGLRTDSHRHSLQNSVPLTIYHQTTSKFDYGGN